MRKVWSSKFRFVGKSLVTEGPTASIRPTAFTDPQSAGQYYTLTGLRVAAGTKGLLIMGGKKRIFK